MEREVIDVRRSGDVEPFVASVRVWAAGSEAAAEALAELGAAFARAAEILATLPPPTRWERFCYWMHDFWLTPRW